jgi:hypothetical protein
VLPGVSLFSFLAPDFIMYNPIRMKTTGPAIGGTKYFQFQSPHGDAMIVYQSTVKRMVEDKPRTTKPIQNILVFSPSNMASHQTTKMLEIIKDNTYSHIHRHNDAPIIDRKEAQ